MRESGKVVCPNRDSTDFEANRRLGWKSWKGAYSYTLPHGGSGQPIWLGLDGNAALHGRGGNFFGQLGNGTRGSKLDSSDLGKLGRVSAFDLASTHACAILSGRVACWGESTAGQVPKDEPLELEACDVDMSETKAAWRKQALAQNLAAEASIRACRSQPRALDCELGHRPADPDTVPDNFRVFETDGQCIESTTPLDVVIEPNPVFVPELDDAVQLVLANRVSCALRKNGKVRCWGKPTAFRLNPDDGSPY
jgi:alpha-tubulin suppressor-like RCC1 family protein